MLHKAFWDTVSEEIKQTPPKYIKALTVFADIKEVRKYGFLFLKV